MFDFLRSKKKKHGENSKKNQLWKLDLPIQDIRAVVFDTELTGLNRKKDSIVSIGAVKMSGGRVEIGQTFYQLVNPGIEMQAQVVVVHEITPSEVEEKPNIGPVLSRFLDFCGDDILIGHYISLDLAFVNRELKINQGHTLQNPAIDTMSLMHWWRSIDLNQGPDRLSPNHFELVAIAKELGIQVQGAHNALMDAFMTAQVFQRLLPRIMEKGVTTLGDLLRIGDPNRPIEAPGGML